MRLHKGLLCFALFTSAAAVQAASDAVVQLAVDFDFSHKVITEDATRAREFAIANSGADLLLYTGSGIAISGPDAADFIITKMPSLEPQGNLASNVRRGEVAFAPGSAGFKTATLNITTNDPAEPVISIPLSGVGLPDRGTTVTGPYTGYGPGISTIGPGGDYTTLADACTSVTATPLTGGDWTFEILADLTETRNSAVAQRDTNGNQVIFRPAEGVNSTVTFTDASTYTPAGHLLIGSVHKPNASLVERIPTDGIVIDGLSGEGHGLTLKNDTESRLWSVILVYGDSDHTAIRNCRIESSTGLILDTPAIHFAAYGGNRLQSVPPAIADDCLIENCTIITTMSASIDSIVHDHYTRTADGPANYEASTPEVPGLQIRNNVFEARGTILSATMARHVNMTSNTINYYVPQDQPQRIFRPNIIEIGGFYSPNVTGHTEIAGNRINVIGAAESNVRFSGISIDGTTTSSICLIANNMISGITAAPGQPSSSIARSVIAVTSGRESTATIVHNSIHMPASDNLEGRSVFGVGSGTAGWPGDLVIKNNIIWTGVTDGHALYNYRGIGRFLCDHNDIHVTSGSNVGLWQGSTLPELADWQTSTGRDLNSVSVDPFEPVSEGLGSWMQQAESTGDSQAEDLHFTGFPGSIYLVPKIDNIDTDIDGEPRSENSAIIGADEVPHHWARVHGWEIYQEQ